MYRRRRITVVALLSILVLLPWCVQRDDGEGGESVAAGTGGGPAVACGSSVAELPLRSRLALTLLVGVDGDAPDAVTALLDSPARPGGVFVRGGKAVWEQGTIADRPRDGLPLVVAVDDEGGRVQPLQGVLDDLPSAAELAERSADDIHGLAAGRGGDLRDLGVTMVLGPVADVGRGGGIGDRSFGETSDAVAERAGAYAAGLREAGILPVLKHFPGQGHADADTHERPSTVPPLDLLRTSDLVPYATLLAARPVGVMVGHLDVPDLTAGGVPASLSPAAIGLLRAGYEFDGLVVSDDVVAMQAVVARFRPPEAAERALAAGVDLVLLAEPTDLAPILDRLEEAVTLGRLPQRRVEAALGRVAAAGCAS